MEAAAFERVDFLTYRLSVRDVMCWLDHCGPQGATAKQLAGNFPPP